ncbi:MAG: L-serine ammonia-lyase [Candidatus Acidiferrales bacterium]
MKTSLFEIFKIGIGPSSSHTVGPMRAAYDFASGLETSATLPRVARIETELYGSLALTGRGHGTDGAIQLGLAGEVPDQIDPEFVDGKLEAIRTSRELDVLGKRAIRFEESRDLIFHRDKTLPAHSNGMRFRALDAQSIVLREQVYYSVGGGFIEKEGEELAVRSRAAVPYPFSSAEELLNIGSDQGFGIWKIALENEKTWHSESEVRAYVEQIWCVMQECVGRGLKTKGVLPGGLNVGRRAHALAGRLLRDRSSDPLAPMDWVNVFAIAVNEENAAGGRVVTAPTNGAAGIIPAVAHYYMRFVAKASEEGLFRYFLTASAIGILYKENASISGAEVGCQGEVGVACSMAAGGLVAALGGKNRHVEHAAEIGMEHNLGMTCDPVAGLVQIPCIERNAMGAVKAINASRIAMNETGEHKVSLDQVIQTMYQTGLDMQSRYKETSLAGLALNIIKC